MMDMEFFTDQILPELDRADYVGGIDNEAIFFEDLQVTTGIGRLAADVGRSNNGGSEHPTPVTSPNAMGPMTSVATCLPPIPTVSGRISLATAPIIVPTTAATPPHVGLHHNSSHHNHNINNTSSSSSSSVNTSATHTHLPESPPDSGSEPPYSPLQDVQVYNNNNNSSSGNVQQQNANANLTLTTAINDLQHLQQQQQLVAGQHHYMTPSPPQHHSQQHNPYGHLMQSSSPIDDNIRIKHEAGLIISPNSLSMNGQNLHHLRNVTDGHIDMASQQSPQMIFNNGNNHHLYSPNVMTNHPPPTPASTSSTYHVNMSDVNLDPSATCILTSIGDLPHVQAIGTSHASIPSTPQLSRTSAPGTPNHQSSSRKRKMTVQPEIPLEFGACVKPDPGLLLSPSRSSICSTPMSAGVAENMGGGSSNRSATSPITIQLNASDIPDTPAHSTASLSPALSTANMDTGSLKNADGTNSDAMSPCIRFTAFQTQNWHKLCDQSLQEISVVYYRVDADKGFNFSVSDDAFVCQKKNHFQITCHARLQGEATFVTTPSGLEKIKSFHLHFYGVKLEAPNQTIRVEQSQSDRSKKPFFPVPIDLQSHIVSKVTVGRLHFSETTNNNMRKKGRPNPEQRYFQLVVGLHVHTASGDFPIVSQASDKIIVRASNPGQFESDVDLCWQRGLTQDSIYHAGRVGINTDRPDESLVVHGNLKISGHIVQPSDSRAKQEIGELDTSVQLRNLQKIRIVRYRLEPQFAVHSGLKCANDSKDIVDTGVIAQEVREVIPDAVQEAGSVVLPNGEVIENFLLVNKDRILMENIGAVKELCNITGTLETRIENLERVNHRLQRSTLQELQYVRCSSAAAEAGINSTKDGYEICSNRTLQVIIFLLVIVMAACLAAVSTLYFVEHNKKQHNYKHLESLQILSNGHKSLTDQERNFIHSMLYTKGNHTLWPPPYYPGVEVADGDEMAMHSKSYHGRNKTDAHHQRFGGELMYFETSDDVLTSSTHLRNDEITVVMEKPSVGQHDYLQSYKDLPAATAAVQTLSYKTTPAPVILARTNKTINSKHKIKWPQPQMVRAVQAIQEATLRNALPSNKVPTNSQPQQTTAPNSSSAAIVVSVQLNKNISNTAPAEKIADVDFENNSIDTDSQQVLTGLRHKSLSNGKAQRLSTNVKEVASHSGIQKLSDDSDITVSTSSSNVIGDAISVDNIISSATPTNIYRSSSKSGDLNNYKTVSPPTSVLTTSSHSSVAGAVTSSSITTTSTTTTTTRSQINHNLNTDAPPHTNYSSLDIQTISNKSRNFVEHNSPADNGEDLQTLTNNNESIFNPIQTDKVDRQFYNQFDSQQLALGRHSVVTSAVDFNARPHRLNVESSTVQVEIFGEPEECSNKAKRDEVSNCQSVCFEETNQLPVPSQPIINERKQRKIVHQPPDDLDNENHSEAEDNDAILPDNDDDIQITYEVSTLNTKDTFNVSLLQQKQQQQQQQQLGKQSHATAALSKKLNDADEGQLQQQQHHQKPKIEDSETLESSANFEHSFSDETTDNDDESNDTLEKKKTNTADRTDDIIEPSLELNRPPTDADCWKIRSCILAERLNNTFAIKEYCPKLGNYMNLTYIMPLSRFFKEQSIELHLTSSLPLQWIVCNLREQSKQNGKHLTSSSNAPQYPQASPNILQRRKNTSLLTLEIPSRGYFVKDLILRATSDSEKLNVCQEQPNEGNTILQYNFRILRDCD